MDLHREMWGVTWYTALSARRSSTFAAPREAQECLIACFYGWRLAQRDLRVSVHHRARYSDTGYTSCVSDCRTPEVPRDLAQQALGEGLQHHVGRTAVGAAPGGSYRHLLAYYQNALARHATAEPWPRYLSSQCSVHPKFDLSYVLVIYNK